ncbi:hypothetical protein MSAN_02009100 [Mycena sanguinolenta]|uniref:Uncharacterized protein n=1 Tax=Mycena sanguinolenta TaxID=230812 RepID=A0A8H7CNW6_9AGAR|nr:hypothetical protein MSAN_02009100 [Mycena sanguinolenta]
MGAFSNTKVLSASEIFRAASAVRTDASSTNGAFLQAVSFRRASTIPTSSHCHPYRSQCSFGRVPWALALRAY